MQTRLCIVSIGIGKDNASDSDVRVYRRGRTVLLVEQFYFAAIFAVVVEVLRGFVLAQLFEAITSPHNRLHTKKAHPPISPLPSNSCCTRLATAYRTRLFLSNYWLYTTHISSPRARSKAIDLTARQILSLSNWQRGISYLDATII
jgi:hypothetical protein